METVVGKGEQVLLRRGVDHLNVVPPESIAGFEKTLEAIEEKVDRNRFGSGPTFALFEGKGFSGFDSLITCTTFPSFKIIETPKGGLWTLFIDMVKDWNGMEFKHYIDHFVVVPSGAYRETPRTQLSDLFIRQSPDVVERILSEGTNVVEAWQPILSPIGQAHSQ